jgi:hypothetical protein
LDKVECDILVEGVDKDFGDPRVVPGAVDEEQPLEEAELGDGEVRGVGGLEPLVARKADPDPRGLYRVPQPVASYLDHCHIVGSVPDGEADLTMGEVLHQFHHVGLLARAHPAAYDRLAPVEGLRRTKLMAAPDAQIGELLRHCFVLEDEAEGSTVDDHRVLVVLASG